MSVEGLLISIILTAIIAGLVAAPLLRRSNSQIAEDVLAQKQRERLLVYYERVLTNIRDLDEDHATGKMLDADYASEREEWVQRGIQVLKALDQLGDQSPAPATDAAGVDASIDDAIEAAIQTFKDRSATPRKP